MVDFGGYGVEDRPLPARVVAPSGPTRRPVRRSVGTPCRRAPARCPRIGQWSILVRLVSRIGHCLLGGGVVPPDALRATREYRPVVDFDLSGDEDGPYPRPPDSPRRDRLDGRRPDGTRIGRGPETGPAGVVELVDTQDLGSCAFGREGSSPFFGTSGRFDGTPKSFVRNGPRARKWACTWSSSAPPRPDRAPRLSHSDGSPSRTGARASQDPGEPDSGQAHAGV